MNRRTGYHILWIWLLSWLLLPVAMAAESLEIAGPDGRLILKFKHRDDKIKIENAAGETLLQTKSRPDGKRRYKDLRDQVFVEVKDQDSGFRLEGHDDSLLWKIKRAPDRLKISQNEQNLLPEVLERTAPGLWSLPRNDMVYAKVRHDPKSGWIRVQDDQEEVRYQIKDAPFSPLYGVLLIPNMEPRMAYVIMAELWLRGW